MTSTPRENLSRVSQLDFLRAMAIFLVLFRHHKLVDYLQNIGWAGVDLFFVISGFLVTSLIFREYKSTEAFSAKNFLIRRGLKIYPLFYFFIAVSFGFLWIASTYTGYVKENLGSKTLVELFFLQNYFEGLWAHTWSLAIEEHFYFGIAILLYLIIRFKSAWMKFVPVLFVILLALVLCLRIFHLRANPSIDYLTHMYPTHLRFDSLLFGSLIAYLYLFSDRFNAFFKVRKWRILLFLLAVGVLTFVLDHSVLSSFMVSIGFSLLYLCFGIILITFLFEPDFFRSLERFGWYRVIIGIGKDSYAIYLFHMFLPSIFDNISYFNNVDFRIRFVIYFVVSIVCGKIISRLIEQPILTLRDRIFPAKAKAI